MLEETLQIFGKDLKNILGIKFYDILIWGSTVLNDFTPHRGDIDFIVLLNSDINEIEISKLEELHDSYRNDKIGLTYQLEGCYYPKKILNEIDEKFYGLYIGTRRKGWKVITKFENSMLDLVQWKMNGRMVYGNSMEINIPNEIAINKNIEKDYLQWKKYIDDIDLPSYVVVQWVARTLFFLNYKRIGSKTESCRYFYDNYYKNEYVKESISIRSPVSVDVLKHNVNSKEVAKKCLEIIFEEFPKFGLTIAST